MSMSNIDKIIQIIKGDEEYTIHGISESGKLYALIVSNMGEYVWKFIANSPDLDAE